MSLRTDCTSDPPRCLPFTAFAPTYAGPPSPFTPPLHHPRHHFPVSVFPPTARPAKEVCPVPKPVTKACELLTDLFENKSLAHRTPPPSIQPDLAPRYETDTDTDTDTYDNRPRYARTLRTENIGEKQNEVAEIEQRRRAKDDGVDKRSSVPNMSETVVANI